MNDRVHVCMHVCVCMSVWSVGKGIELLKVAGNTNKYLMKCSQGRNDSFLFQTPCRGSLRPKFKDIKWLHRVS